MFAQVFENGAQYAVQNIGQPLTEFLKTKGAPVDIQVDLYDSSLFLATEEKPISTEPVIKIIYSHNEQYFFQHDTLIGGGLGFIDKKTEYEAMDEFYEKYYGE